MINCSGTWKVRLDASPDAFDLIVLKLKEHLSSIDLGLLVGNRSASIKGQFDQFAPGAEFRQLGLAVDPNVLGRVPAGHRIDQAYQHIDGGTIGIELCLNNREAIGTNFSKLYSYVNKREDSPNYRLVTLVTLSRSLLDHGGWDKSYGDSSEYSEGFDLIYGEFASGNVVILTLSLAN